MTKVDKQRNASYSTCVQYVHINRMSPHSVHVYTLKEYYHVLPYTRSANVRNTPKGFLASRNACVSVYV